MNKLDLVYQLDATTKQKIQFTSVADRIKQLYAHAKNYNDLDNALWPYQSFCFTVGELLKAALHGNRSFDLPETKQKLEDLYRHILTYNQKNDTLCAYQSFSVSVGEVVEAALYKINPNAIHTIRQDVEDLKKNYFNLTYKYDSSKPKSVFG